MITERDLEDLVLNGLKTHIKERLESYEFLSINQVLQKALAQEIRSKEVHRSTTDRPRMHIVEHNDDNLDDEVMSILLNLFGPQRPNPICAMLLSRFARIVMTR